MSDGRWEKKVKVSVKAEVEEVGEYVRGRCRCWCKCSGDRGVGRI